MARILTEETEGSKLGASGILKAVILERLAEKARKVWGAVRKTLE